MCVVWTNGAWGRLKAQENTPGIFWIYGNFIIFRSIYVCSLYIECRTCITAHKILIQLFFSARNTWITKAVISKFE